MASPENRLIIDAGIELIRPGSRTHLGGGAGAAPVGKGLIS
jgi:hypothetical protein